jgi:hypothetical protein
MSLFGVVQTPGRDGCSIPAIFTLSDSPPSQLRRRSVGTTVARYLRASYSAFATFRTTVCRHSFRLLAAWLGRRVVRPQAGDRFGDRGRSWLRSLHQRYLDHLPAFVVYERFANLFYDVVWLTETGAVLANFQNISVQCGHLYDEALHPFTFKTEAVLAAGSLNAPEDRSPEKTLPRLRRSRAPHPHESLFPRAANHLAPIPDDCHGAYIIPRHEDGFWLRGSGCIGWHEASRRSR